MSGSFAHFTHLFFLLTCLFHAIKQMLIALLFASSSLCSKIIWSLNLWRQTINACRSNVPLRNFPQFASLSAFESTSSSNRWKTDFSIITSWWIWTSFVCASLRRQRENRDGVENDSLRRHHVASALSLWWRHFDTKDLHLKNDRSDKKWAVKVRDISANGIHVIYHCLQFIWK